MQNEHESKNFIFRLWKSISQKADPEKDIEKERIKKLRLLFKACALVIYADKKFSPEEVIGLQTIFEESNIKEEDRKYLTYCINKTVTIEDIKKELQEHNYTREELGEIIELCTGLGKVDKLNNEEKIVIRKLKNIFGLEKN